MVVLYVLVCIFLFFFQEKLIFFPEKLDKSFQFQFDQKFEEKNILLTDGTILNGIVFKAANSRGLIFYLHGNAGSLNSWGEEAKTYTSLNYDVFMLDYRGFGKSQGSITGQDQIYKDVQTAYSELKKTYLEEAIIILGYSIGTGPASKLASTNQPKLLILQAPYFSLTDMMRNRFPIVPTLILKYKFETNQYLQQCSMPVFVFHGDADEVIYYGSSLKLKKHCNNQISLITLTGHGHNAMTENQFYKTEIKNILAQ